MHLSQFLSTLSSETGSLASLPGQGASGILLSLLPKALGLQMPECFHGLCGVELRTACLYSKHFAQTSISLSPADVLLRILSKCWEISVCLLPGSFLISNSRAFMITRILLVITIQIGDTVAGTKWVENCQGSYLISTYIQPSVGSSVPEDTTLLGSSLKLSLG